MAVQPGVWPRQAHTYRLPDLLADIRLLDLLELSGSTRQASQLLQISQPSVSRRYRALADDFGLRPEPAEPLRCRYGSTRTMQALRHSCRCHRLESGVARVGSDPIHADLLEGVPWLLPTPLRFRAVDQWLQLVREGVLDGALLSGLELERMKPPDLSDLELHRVGPLPLALAMANEPAPPPSTPELVLLPDVGVAPGLWRWLSERGWELRSAGTSCRAPGQWLGKLRGRNVAMLIGVAVAADARRISALRLIPLQPPAESLVWLALPVGNSGEPLLHHTLERLRGQLMPTA